MRKLILRNSLSPGDVVMLTAAVRDLHVCYPDQFITDVRTPYPQLWENNPCLCPLVESDPDVEKIDCHYPLIQQSNQRPYHFIHAFIRYLNERLELRIEPTAFKGDIYLSEQEKSWYSQVHEIVGDDRPFWVVAAGGKFDFTIKWWDLRRFQETIDKLQGKILFVQVGLAEHHHPPLEGVIDLRGRTDLRQLIRLVYHAQGVLCPVTALMHLAAAVPTKPGQPANRPCVVVAGGREPSHWEAYPNHQFIHTIGALPCCESGGCWKSRVAPIGDGDEKDRPDNLCSNIAGKLPKCMDMISVDEVVNRIKTYFTGGVIRYLGDKTQVSGRDTAPLVWEELSKKHEFTPENANATAESIIAAMPEYPGYYRERGIVICGGGLTYFTNAWVCVNMLRKLGCRLPIQLWHLGPREVDETMAGLMGELDVQCVDALKVRERSPCRRLNGWELKPYAILHCLFKEVLLLDSDNLPIMRPEGLFEWDEYQSVGAVFWPDYLRLGPEREIWRICGVSYRDEPEFESGQVLLNKEKCWRALLLCLWYNANSDFFYRFIYGDKETFHMAFRRLDQPYAMPSRGIFSLVQTMCQHDFQGNRIFQHRNCNKWKFEGTNKQIEGFLHENECREFIALLRQKWDGKIRPRKWSDRAKVVASGLTANTFVYNRVGYDQREMTFSADGTVGRGAAERERTWDLKEESTGQFHLQIFGGNQLTCDLVVDEAGAWRGRWCEHERMPIELRPKSEPDFRPGTTDNVVWDEVYSRNLYGLPDVLHPDAIILDVGAHIGAFTCACLARGAQYVYAYEPDTANYRQALANVGRCFKRVRRSQEHCPVCLDNVAIWRSDRAEQVSLSERMSLEPTLSLKDTAGLTTVFSGEGTVPCQTAGLDVVVKELPYVTLLKLHCEGAEWPILLTAKCLNKVERIVVQLHAVEQLAPGPCRGLRPGILSEVKNYRLKTLADHLAQWGFSIRECPSVANEDCGGAHLENQINGTGPLYFCKRNLTGWSTG